MKILAFIIGMLVFASPGTAQEADPTTGVTNSDFATQYDETNQENHSFNSPSSSMSNVQINPWGNARDTYGEGVSCSKPSVNIGIAGGERPHRTMAYASVNIPLGMKDCKELAQTRKRTLEYKLTQMQTEQRKADVLFAAKMANMCMDIQRHITIDAENPLYSECAQYISITPTPDEIAQISLQWKQTSQQLNGISTRVNTLESVAHKPQETYLLNP